MANYDFSTLNDKEFEQLSLDLLNIKFNLQLQGFKIGKDKGIDLRFSTKDNSNSIIVQVKHYISSGYNQLKSTLKNDELPKIKKLNPGKYKIVTSLPLSAQNKDEIKQLLEPYIETANDVYGKDDLNQFIREFPEIEKNYFKLWFSSTNVLFSILNNAVEGRTRSHLELIKDKIKYYVITKKLDEANKILLDEKILLITGQPGIGKTTLADIILFEKAKYGFKVYKVENIREAEDIFSQASEEMQLFYFDDFLGANYLEITSTQKTETQITSFVDRIKKTPNKYLILTTRTVILNYAVERYEKISNSKISSSQFELKLNDYTKFEKALILYNHLFFKSVSETLYNCILNEKFYKEIIAHKNYTPRIIDFITDTSKIGHFLPQEYKEFIIGNLKNPKEIWRYSFNNQIDYMDRCFLWTLFTFQERVQESVLIKAFESRISFEKTHHNQILRSNQFNDSVQILLNGFITSSITGSNGTRFYSFINPSLGDFLIWYASESFQERKSIITSIIYFDQLYTFLPEKNKIPLEKDLQVIIRNKVVTGELYRISEAFYTDNDRAIDNIFTLLSFCKDINTDSVMHYNINKIDFAKLIQPNTDIILQLLTEIEDSPLTYEYIVTNFFHIIKGLTNFIDEYENALQIPELFNKFGFNYDEYLESKDGKGEIFQLIKNVLLTKEEYLKDDNKDSVVDIDQVEKLYDEIDELKKELHDALLPTITLQYHYHDYGINFNETYWESKIENNLNRESKYDYEDYREYYKELEDEDNAIDNLFVK